MGVFEFAICVKDEADLESGHKRMKQGDIIAVKPAGWQWGKKELDGFLIVPVTGLTKEEAHSMCQPHYDGGVKQEEITEESTSAVVGKRRYNIPLDTIKNGWCKDMKTADVENKTKIYQPLKDANIKLDFTEKVSICKDKHSGKFKYAAKKIGG